jgi:hypothetical protein
MKNPIIFLAICAFIIFFILGMFVSSNKDKSSLVPSISMDWNAAPEEVELIAYISIDGSGKVYPFRCYKLGEFAFDDLPDAMHPEKPLYGWVKYWHLLPVTP